MKYFFFLLLLFTLGQRLSAQDSIKRKVNFRLHLGLNHLIIKDEYRSPFVYKGLNTHVEIYREAIKLKTRRQISANYIAGTIKTSFSPLATNKILELRYSYLLKTLVRKNWSIFAGPDVLAKGWRANFFPEMEAPINSLVQSYFAVLSIGASALSEFNLSPRHKLCLQLSMPVANYVLRPKFLNKNKAGAFGVANLWNPDVKLTFETKISDSFSMLFNYHYSYFYYQQPRSIRMLNNGISLGFKFQFK